MPSFVGLGLLERVQGLLEVTVGLPHVGLTFGVGVA
jgi:hypothetical protein